MPKVSNICQSCGVNLTLSDDEHMAGCPNDDWDREDEDLDLDDPAANFAVILVETVTTRAKMAAQNLDFMKAGLVTENQFNQIVNISAMVYTQFAIEQDLFDENKVTNAMNGTAFNDDISPEDFAG